MNHKSVITFVLSMMTVIALLIVTVSPASANCVTVNQISDRQELADVHSGSLSLGECTSVLERNSYDQINSLAELAEYQAAVAGQSFFVDETITVAEYDLFDQIENRAELAEYQAFIVNHSYSVEESNLVVAHNPFDQIEDRAELAAYQASITNQPISQNEAYNMIAMK